VGHPPYALEAGDEAGFKFLTLHRLIQYRCPVYTEDDAHVTRCHLCMISRIGSPLGHWWDNKVIKRGFVRDNDWIAFQRNCEGGVKVDEMKVRVGVYLRIVFDLRKKKYCKMRTMQTSSLVKEIASSREVITSEIEGIIYCRLIGPPRHIIPESLWRRWTGACKQCKQQGH